MSIAGPTSEGHAYRPNEDLFVRPRVEPVTAERESAPGRLHERPTLDVTLAAVDPGPLAGNAEPKPLHGPGHTDNYRPLRCYGQLTRCHQVEGKHGHTEALQDGILIEDC